MLAGSAATALFIISHLAMVVRALRTGDVRSYSRRSLAMANAGNVAQTVYVASLPFGPIWFLHGFYLVVTALMLGLVLLDGHAEPEQRGRATSSAAHDGTSSPVRSSS